MLQRFSRFAKILYFVLFATVGVYWAVAELVAPGMDASERGALKLILSLFAAATAAAVLYLRFARIPPLLENPTIETGRRLAQLRMFYILCFVLSETVALYGFVLRLLGASRADTNLLFGGAVVLFLLCYPRTPVGISGPRSYA